MRLKEAWARLLEDATDMEAYREVQHRQKLLVWTVTQGPPSEEEEREEGDACEERNAEEAEWIQSTVGRCKREGKELKSEFVDELVGKTPEDADGWKEIFFGDKVAKTGWTKRRKPLQGADGLRAFLVQVFKTAAGKKSLADAFQAVGARLMSDRFRFSGTRQRWLREVDASLGSSWGRVWLRLAESKKLRDSTTAEESSPGLRKLRVGGKGESPGRILRSAFPSVVEEEAEEEEVREFRNVVDAVVEKLKEKIDEAEAAQRAAQQAERAERSEQPNEGPQGPEGPASLLEEYLEEKKKKTSPR